MIDVGVLGVGHMGWLHARTLASMPRAKLTAVLDVDGPRAARAAAEFGAASVESIDALAERCRAVVVAAPTSVHHELAMACLDRNLHVFLEKPIAATVDEAREIGEKAAATDRVLGVGHVERFNPVFQAVVDTIERPLFIEAHRLAPFVPRSIDVDVILDLMIHDIQLVATAIPEEIERIDASGVPVITPIEDIANARVAFEGGAVANLTASRVSRERMRRIRFFSGRAYFSLDLLRRTGEIIRLAADPREWLARGEVPPPSALLRQEQIGPFSEANPLAMELDDFIAAVDDHRTPLVDGAGATKALGLALDIRARVLAQLRKVKRDD